MKELLASFYASIKKYELKILSNDLLVFLLIIANLIGGLIGFQYYFDVIGLAEYPVHIWILIPDCPTAVILLIPVYLQRSNPRFDNYNFFALVQGIRAAIITYIIVFNFGGLDTEIVLIGHTLLLFQALAIIPIFNQMKLGTGTIIAIFVIIFNDISDIFGILSLWGPTLAQLPTLQPILTSFVFVIYSLDLILILSFIGVATRKKRLWVKVSKN